MANMLGILLLIAYPLSMHFSILAGYDDLLAWIVLIVAGLHLLLIHNSRIKIVVYGCVMSVAFLNIISQYDFVIYLPPLLIPTVLLAVFASSLRQNEEAFITKIARRLSVEKLSAKEEIYTRHVTQIWLIFFLAMIIETMFLTFFAEREVWSVFTNIYNYIFIAGLFLIEYLFRMFYFKRKPSIAMVKQLFIPHQ